MEQSAKILLLTLALLILVFSHIAQSGQTKVYRVGVIHQGGPYQVVVDGLRDGLRQLGYEQGKHFLLEIQDTKGDLKAVDEATRNLERDRVDLIYAIATSVSIAVRRATADIPIVFCAAADPVALGLVDSFAKPGGRLTGVYFLAADLTAKRLEILKDIIPKLRRVVTFYDPGNPVTREASRLGREEARRLRVEFVERHVGSVQEFQAGLQALKTKEVDAFLLVADAMVLTQSQLIIDTTRAKRLPTMFWEEGSVINGGLASYGVSYYEAGRLSAKYIQRILTGTRPQDLPVETVRKIDLVFNLRTAREIGLTIPPNVLFRADKIIK
jgi:putative tryptophan/tyrosine transport system substrate-binding protein